VESLVKYLDFFKFIYFYIVYVRILINNFKKKWRVNPLIRHKMGWGEIFNPISLVGPPRSALFRRGGAGWPFLPSLVGGCGLQETATHLFLNYDTFRNLWVVVLHLLNIHFVAPEVLRAHLLQFGHLTGLPRFTYSFLKLIWLACVSVIWKERNKRVFNQKASELQ